MLSRDGTLVTHTPQQAFQVRLAWAELQRLHQEQWNTPDALPLAAWISREWFRAFAADESGRLPLLLSPLQELALWERILESQSGNEWLQPRGVARAVRRSWRLLHEWKIDARRVAVSGNEEPAAFARWTEIFRDELSTRGWLTAAQAQWHVPILPAGRVEWRAAGFDVETPALKAIAAALGVPSMMRSVAGMESHATRVAATDGASELEAAAAWCLERLETNEHARLLVIVPDLQARRSQVELTFDDILRPGRLLAPPGGIVAVEGGPPLDRYTLVDTALVAFRLACEPVEFEPLSGWLRSPYLREGRARASERARMDAQLRERLTPEVTLAQLVKHWSHCEQRIGTQDPLLEGLRRLQEMNRGRQSLGSWSSAFNSALRALGWPGDATLDSGERQTLDKFKQALGNLATIEEILGPVDLAAAQRQLRRIARDTPFQPETGDVNVVVSSQLGDPAVAFDGIWICGMHEAAWPRAPRPDPFIPWQLQREARIPQATAEGTRALAQSVTQRLLSSAPEIVLSWPQRLDDDESLPSPLIAQLPLRSEPRPARRGGYRNAIHRSARLEEMLDERAPPLARPAALRGGVKAFRLQSLCPFRAFAQQRLQARLLDRPEPGISARARGEIVHDALARLWRELQSSDALRALDDTALDRLLQRISAAATTRVARLDGVSSELVELERERLVAVLGELLALERQRPAFRLFEPELEVSVEIAGLQVQLRVDRLDELADGRRLVIDYKTGEGTAAAWEGVRPDDLQLPLYAVSLQPRPDAVAFAVIRTGECAFKGVSSDPPAFPGAARVEDWPRRVAEWRETVDRLAEDFALGAAQVDPRDGPGTCRLCHLHSLCRIDEITSSGEERA